ncbi:MAG: diacylglycerol kinase family protein, partial [Lutibacter sp.]|nr:diacylglycerol kinase family protein [Lutibacter sp.]
NHLKLVNAINGLFSGYKSRTYVSESAGQFNSLCKKALSSQCNHLVFVGGDGSLNEGVNGLLAYYKLGAGNQPEAYDWTAVQKIK